ncbi:class A beta-lactamase [Falsirhodobacter deserti]|uniref:class A beta-lactamase n=1 Tax=Falsirhodobacter deserti TaxID=1365611 RepID=UPI000FE3FA1F|nr:class A beta-lactamase [Falsirhodobacter deserti]
MVSLPLFLRRLADAAAATLLAAPALHAAPDPLPATITRWETQLSARIGVALHDSGSGQSWGYREDERFPLNSTVKVPICGGILALADQDQLELEEGVTITEGDILSYAPVTREHVGEQLTVSDLCFAALDRSDNTAANLLIRRAGGVGALTEFLRGIGDDVTRLDRMEPELNSYDTGELRDTTTPAAMIATLQRLAQGDALQPASQERLVGWMQPGGVTGPLLRPSIPEGWDIADKSGAGDNSRSIVAMITPPGGAPAFLAIYIAQTDADLNTRNAAVAEIGAELVRILKD